MSRPVLVAAAAVVLVIARAALAQVVRSAQNGPEGQAAAAQARNERAALLERWRESLALDLPAEVLAEGEALVAPGGKLAADGEALALVARARVETRADGVAAALELLDRAKPDPATRDFVVLERIRCQILDDDLSGALMALLPSPDAREPRLAARAESWLLAGRAWARSGSLERSAPFLARFVELAPRDRETPSALHLLAQEALARGDGPAAQAAVQRAESLGRWHQLWKVRAIQVREQPDEPLPRLGLAQLWLQAAEPERAKRILLETCERFPTFSAAPFHLGEAERMLGDLDAAVRAYDRTIELEPDHLLARHNRATIHRIRGRLAESRADFEAIVAGPRSTDPRALASHLGLARVLAELGEDAAAAQRYARYLELGGKELLQERGK